jgi:hypothetical protein
MSELRTLAEPENVGANGSLNSHRLFAAVDWMACVQVRHSAAPAFGVTIVYTTSLSGPNENPPIASPGVGVGTVTVDTTAHTLRVQEKFSGLTTGTTASHIHCCVATPTGTAGVATMTPTFSGLPLGVTLGSMDQTFDTLATSTYNAPFVTANGGTAAGAEAALFTGLAAGTAYLNIHTTQNLGGEIRGFLTVAAPVPEPETYALFLAGLASLGVAARRHHHREAARRGD